MAIINVSGSISATAVLSGELNINYGLNGTVGGFSSLVLDEFTEVINSFDALPSGAIPVPAPDEYGKIVLIQESGYYYMTQSIASYGMSFLIANRDITLDCRGYRIYGNRSGHFGGDIGSSQDPRRSTIHLYLSFADKSIPNPGPWQESFNFNLKNGVIHGGPTGLLNHAITGFRANNTLIENCWIKVAGRESQPVFFNGSGPLIGKFLTLESFADMSTANRHQIKENASFSCATSPLLEDSVIWGGEVGMIGGGPNSGMKRCVVMHNSVNTNGVLWNAFEAGEWVIEDNVCMPYNGRGLLVDGDQTAVAGSGGFYQNNVLMALETPNSEFPQGNLTGNCLKTRTSVMGTYQNNDMLAIGGYPWCGGVAAFLRNTNINYSLTMMNNILRGILVGEPGDGGLREKFHVGAGLGFARAGDQTLSIRQPDIIRDNIMESNHHCIDLATDSDSGESIVNQLIGPNNVLRLRHGQNILDDWYTAAVAKIAEINMDTHPLVIKRLAEVQALFDSIRGDCDLRDDAYHIFADAVKWTAPGSSILVDILDSGTEPPLTVLRVPGPEPFLVQILQSILRGQPTTIIPSYMGTLYKKKHKFLDSAQIASFGTFSGSVVSSSVIDGTLNVDTILQGIIDNISTLSAALEGGSGLVLLTSSINSAVNITGQLSLTKLAEVNFGNISTLSSELDILTSLNGQIVGISDVSGNMAFGVLLYSGTAEFNLKLIGDLDFNLEL